MAITKDDVKELICQEAVTKKNVWKFALSFGLPILVCGAALYGFYRTAPLTYAGKEEVKAIQSEVKVNGERYKLLKESIDALIKQIIENNKELKEDLKNEIKELKEKINENGG